MSIPALGPKTVICMEGEAKSRLEAGFRWAWRISLGILVLLLIGLAVLVAVGEPYEPGGTLGYTLGVIGGLLMLSQLVYPMRKRFPLLARLGMMDRWFKYHMAVGITAPLLVLFHSTFKPSSINASIAFYAMLLVVLSGIVGRFIYRRVHRGLYGRQLTLGDVTTELRASLENIGSVYSLRPDIEPRLMAFYREAFDTDIGVAKKAWRFMTIRLRARRLSLVLKNDAKRALRRRRRSQGTGKTEAILSYKLARRQIDGFLSAVVQAAQFRPWERFFSLWHVIHLPFLYLLVFSGIVHVIAVHMY